MIPTVNPPFASDRFRDKDRLDLQLSDAVRLYGLCRIFRSEFQIKSRFSVDESSGGVHLVPIGRAHQSGTTRLGTHDNDQPSGNDDRRAPRVVNHGLWLRGSYARLPEAAVDVVSPEVSGTIDEKPVAVDSHKGDDSAPAVPS